MFWQWGGVEFSEVMSLSVVVVLVQWWAYTVLLVGVEGKSRLKSLFSARVCL